MHSTMSKINIMWTIISIRTRYMFSNDNDSLSIFIHERIACFETCYQCISLPPAPPTHTFFGKRYSFPPKITAPRDAMLIFSTLPSFPKYLQIYKYCGLVRPKDLLTSLCSSGHRQVYSSPLGMKKTHYLLGQMGSLLIKIFLCSFLQMLKSAIQQEGYTLVITSLLQEMGHLGSKPSIL